MSSYQNRAVAFEWFFFRAHEGDTKIISHPSKNSLQSVLEQFSFCEAIVLHLPVFVAIGIVTSRAQFLTQKTILDALRKQGFLQLFAVELRIHSAVGFRANVAKRGHAMLP